jgi:hypothetical protein
MNLSFIPTKIKDSENFIFSDSEIKMWSPCFRLNAENELIKIKDEEIKLDNGFSVKIDHNGLVYEIWEDVINKIPENNFNLTDVIDIVKNTFFELEEKIKLLDKKYKSNTDDFINGTNNFIKSSVSDLPQKTTNENRINLLVTAICFINRKKQGAEIYATFANRLLIDVMRKTPYDFRIITNEPHHFDDNKNAWGDRVIVTTDNLDGEKITVGPFNQLLKYKTMIGVDKKYDWLLYLDCDAGFTSELDIERLEKQIRNWETQGYDFLAARTNAVLRNELKDHENKKNNFIQSNPGSEFNPWIHGGNLFSAKFIFYNITSVSGPIEWGDPSKWMDSKLPSEHVWLIKNNEKLERCGRIFKSLNEKFETQSPDNLITWDMEAFEVGVSAKLSGYNMGDLGNDGEFHILKIGFNHNNWEKVKY